MSSLQKAIAEISGPTGLLQNNESKSNNRAGSGGKSSRTITSFEVAGTDATALDDPVAYKHSKGASASLTIGTTDGTTRTARRSSSGSGSIRNINSTTAFYEVIETGVAATTGARRGSNSKTAIKNTKHFTIISAHDDDVEGEKNAYAAMEVDLDRSSTSPHNHGGMDIDGVAAATSLEHINRRPSTRRCSSKTRTFYHVGGMEVEQQTNTYVIGVTDDDDNRKIEQMEGVIDQGTKMPLVVLDGANVGYAYATATAGMNNGSSLDATASSIDNNKKIEPNARGIQIATDFFLEAGLRALVVLPQYWFRESSNSNASSNAMTLTPQLEILSELKAKGLIVASPPTDDDDAYALTIARREEGRSLKPPRNGEGPGFVLSNDLFRDAQGRDPLNGTLKEWLRNGRNESVGPGRISYTFGDMGSMNDRGERVLDFVPNPRHSLIVWMENEGKESDCSYHS